jgi:hypothetical protein
MFSTPNAAKRQGFTVKSPLMKPLITEERCEDVIFKKRRLSSSESDDSFEQKSSLDASFSGLNLNQSATLPVTNTFDSSLYIKVPTPIRAHSTTRRQETSHSENNSKICKTYIKDLMSSKSIQDITKCLQLGKEENEEAKLEPIIPKPKDVAKETASSILRSAGHPFIYFPFGIPSNLGELLAASCRTAAPPKKYIGPLTEEERNKKVQRYWEKKKNKQWKTIRYNVRKNLADQRERFQGRFVKNPNQKFKIGEINTPNQRVTSGLVEEGCQV